MSYLSIKEEMKMRLFGFDNKYPYTDFHELNLDWILQQMYQLNLDMKTFVNINTIKYADPLQWSITTQYEQNTLVQDAMGMTYLSKQAVPVGISISNTDYWLKVADFDAFMTNLKAAITPYDEGSSPIATSDRYVDDFVWINNDLYVVTQDITTGSAYVPGTNCTQISISEALIQIYRSIKANITAVDEGQSPTATANRSEGDLIWINGNLYTITANITAGTAYVPGTNCQQVTIADLLDTSTFVANLEDAINAENEGSSTTATAARAVGDLVWVQDVLYQVISPMIIGDTYVAGSNVQKVAITDLFATLLTLNDLTINGDLQYKDPVPGTYYDTVEVKDTQGNSYNVMVENANTSSIGAGGSLSLQTCRPKLNWYADEVVRILATEFYMNGFRYMGQWTKHGSKLYHINTSENYSLADYRSDMAVIDQANKSCWYGIFAVPDHDDECVIKIAPIFRISAISGNVLTLSASTENQISVPLSSSLLDVSGHDVLLITGSSNRMLGTVKKVVSNTGNTITIDDASDLGSGSYVMIAPVKDDYCYIASHYIDEDNGGNIGGWRNRQDNGVEVRSYGSDHPSSFTTLNSAVAIPNRNNYSPLASGIIFHLVVTSATSETGELYFQAGADASHVYNVFGMTQKTIASTLTVASPQMTVLFDYILVPYFYIGASGITNVTITLKVDGYYEL